MKIFFNLILASILIGPMAFANSYTCRTQSFQPSIDLGSDAWTAVVDLNKGTVELSSDNKTFGKNPFSILKETSAEGFVKGTHVYVENSSTDLSDGYMFIFGVGDGSAGLFKRDKPEADLVNILWDCPETPSDLILSH